MSVLSVFNLGDKGVNVDTDPIHLEDGELTNAQNVIPNPIGAAGGVVNRLGLTKINGSAAADTTIGILGGVGVPLPFVTTRKLYVPVFTIDATHKWATSSTGFTTTAVYAATPAQIFLTPSSSWLNAVGGASLNAFYGQQAIPYSNGIIYVSNNYTVGTDRPPIYYYDGVFDRQLTTAPLNPDIGTVPLGIPCILLVGTTLYFAVHDVGITSGALVLRGSVYSYDLLTGVTTKLGATFALGQMPYCLCWYNNKLWAGVPGQSDHATPGYVYFIRPGIDTAWTQDKAFANNFFPTSITPFNGELYVTTSAIAGTSAIISKRDSGGTWTTVDTAGGTAPTHNNWYNVGTVFGTSIYFSFFEFSVGEIIRKYNGTAWSSAFTNANASAPHYTSSFVDNGVLYMWYAAGHNTNAFLRTTDGASWVDETTNATSSGSFQVGAGAAVITS